ncbi:MAG TPA: GAF domain-containing sensor histidine kinase [Burkholderiales bacterium]|nr:GAF domain-containing sensor histidine kinase [Burkholderiales bacterium]
MDATHVSLPQRMLEILEGLLRIPAGDLQATLIQACDLIAAATGADKIDAFLYDPARDSLVALGTSNQPLSALQRKLGLNVLPVSNGGRSVQVYQTGKVFLNGDVQRDAEELKGLKEALGIRSHLGVPFDVGGERRGVLLAASLKPDFFTEEDARMAETVTRWVGLVAHRAELTEAIRRGATEQGRRAGAEELVTVLAHDLRNYINPMRVRLQVLRHRAGSDAGMREDVETMDRAVGRIEGLVSDILDVARLDRGIFDVTTQNIDLGALAAEVAELFASPQHPVQVSLQKGVPVRVLAEPARLRQCLENLVANAMQKSPNYAAVTVAVQREVLANGTAIARVDVIDEGPGIPEEILPHLFDRFATSRLREGGLGLGLYLAKRIAAAHGGDLTAHSEPGRGARFTLKLPAAGTGAARPAVR